jgi:hypothetical protein
MSLGGMRVLAVSAALAVLGCSPGPQSYPALDSKYEECLTAELDRAGYKYERVNEPAPKSVPPTAWPARDGYIRWTPSSEEAQQRLWCEVAFCYADTRDVTKGAFPDVCKAFSNPPNTALERTRER